MIFFLPTELLSSIFDNLTSKQDQLSTQLVCRSWHEPAKRAFYTQVVIQEWHDASHYNHYNKTYQFINFIRCMSSATPSDSKISLAGHYVKKLQVETKFMPTAADYQLLATACPNLEKFDFPPTMFWNYFISAHLNHYWTKLKRVPEFRYTPTMTRYQLERLLFFKSSLTYLEINYYNSGSQQQHEQFTQLIKLFTNLKKLKITSSTLCFSRMIPTLIACPNITKFTMITTTTSTKDNDLLSMMVPRVRHLDLNVRIMSSHLISGITQNFPDLQKLVLHVPPLQQSQISADMMEHLIRFITTHLSQSIIHLFIPINDSTKIINHFLSCCYPPTLAVNISYDSRSSFTTNIPDVSYFRHHHNKQDLFIRYQGSIASHVQPKDLPHMQLLKTSGIFLQQLHIQCPSSLFMAEKNGSVEESCIQAVLMHYCLYVSDLSITQCYFDLKASATKQQSNLKRLTLVKSLITSTSLNHLAQQFPNLRYLRLDQCEFMDDRGIDMPKTGFKKLSIRTKEKLQVNVFEQGLNRCSAATTNGATAATRHVQINCWSMDMLELNYIK